MVRLFSIKYCLKHRNCICLFLTINSLLFIFYPEVKRLTEEIPSKLDISYVSFLSDIRNEQSILQYFEQKEQIMKQSPFKTVLRKTFQEPHNKTSFLIYEYTRHRQFCNRQNGASVFISTCPFQNCQFTCNSSLVDKADAVLMLYSLLNYDQLLHLNTNRNPNQIWLLWHDEPYPPSSTFNNILFNWTISYRLDSEVSVAAYGITFGRNTLLNQLAFDKWINENYKKRHNRAVWFVGNCKSKARLQYYDELKKHFPISAFGKCVANQANDSQMCTRRSRCELQQMVTSKFYLAFESTTSRLDYITEKFWRPLAHGMIPIVLGPKRQDYERVAPPNSFIYANDYSNPEALAKHLNDVATNKNEYEKYHKWRINYEIRYQGQDVEPLRFCELCYKLNTNRDRIWYTNINRYFLETDE